MNKLIINHAYKGDFKIPEKIIVPTGRQSHLGQFLVQQVGKAIARRR
jgi:hypothetical protein